MFDSSLERVIECDNHAGEEKGALQRLQEIKMKEMNRYAASEQSPRVKGLFAAFVH